MSNTGPVTVPDEAPSLYAENIRLNRRVKELEVALRKAEVGLMAGVNKYASRDFHGNIVPGDEQYPWVKAMQIGLDRARAALNTNTERTE